MQVEILWLELAQASQQHRVTCSGFPELIVRVRVAVQEVEASLKLPRTHANVLHDLVRIKLNLAFPSCFEPIRLVLGPCPHCG